jgi:hypothetical protein
MPVATVVELPNGGKLIFGQAPAGGGFVDVGAVTDKLGQAATDKLRQVALENFKKTLASLGDVIQLVEDSVGRITGSAKSVEVEFGVALKGECDLKLVSGSAEAEFKIKVTWEPHHGI